MIGVDENTALIGKLERRVDCQRKKQVHVFTRDGKMSYTRWPDVDARLILHCCTHSEGTFVKKLLQTLTETFGPSGYEDEVREIVRNEVKSLADEIRVDALGNLIARKRPGKAAKDTKKIMIAAHMDEIGVIVSHVDENGFVRFSPIGGVFRRYVLGGRVRFLNGTQGVIGFDRLDNVNELPTLDKVYIDVGATSPKDCPVKIGDVAAFDRPYSELGNRLVAKSMDNRVGVLVAIETLRALKSTPHDVYFVFTTQEEVGIRGAATSAYGVDPDIGIALDVTPSGDTPNSHQNGNGAWKGSLHQDPGCRHDR